MATFDVAKLLNKITQDIPGINTVLKALAKWDVSALTDVPDGAMQATTDANNNLTIKKKVSGSYTPVAKLMHDVDKLDGYHASASATANAVAVRNAQGALPGNILGNSATADTAVALAAGTVVPVNQGGTGATTASQARANLGVADGADFTAHVATQASPSVQGHVKLDALAADGSSTAAPGKYGLGTSVRFVTSANDALNTGFYGFLYTDPNFDPASLPSDSSKYGSLLVLRRGASSVDQYIMGAENWVRRYSSTTGAGNWYPLPSNMTDSTSMLSSTTAASATAVKAVNDSAVHNTGNEIIEGNKSFLGIVRTTSELRMDSPGIVLGTLPAQNTGNALSYRDSNGLWFAQIAGRQNANGNMQARTLLRNAVNGEFATSEFSLWCLADGTAYATCPHPPNDAVGTHVATAYWVINNAMQTGDIIASFAATRAGCLLMNGGAVSRTTYANLFALIGTAFGEGDGSTTFNLPNARDRVLQGANGNLMRYLAAGLPNITGTLVNLNNQNTSAGGTGTGAFLETACVSGVTEGGGYKSYRSYSLDASRSSSKYGASTTVQPAAITVNFFIKY